MAQGWQVQRPTPFGEMVSRVWGGNGSVRRCVLKGETHELAVDVVEVRVVPQHFENGCRLPAHGTLTVAIDSDGAQRALSELAQSREAVVLQRPDGGALEMRLGVLAVTGRATVTYSWHSP